MSKKVVLEEDEYVETLGLIIERDFFPDLPKLQKQTELIDKGLLWTETTPRATSTDQNLASVQVNASGAAWDQASPKLELATIDQTQGEDEDDTAKGSMTLGRFVATHTSEDNKSFNELQEQTVKDHRRKYHWAFDDDKAKGDPKLHLLTDGTWISKERRKIADEACAPKGYTDDRPRAPETWRYRARNPLLFPPELEATRDICRIKANSGRQLLLKNNSYLRSRLPARSRANVVYANSRFSSKQQLIRGEMSMPPREDYPLVPMTPLIAPGVDASPLMTWGDIEGTPTIIDTGATPGHIWNTPSFEVQDTSRREKLATRLESEAHHRNPNSRLPGKTMPLTSRFKAEQKHGSRSVRARMSSVQSVLRTPVGSDPQLRASYSTPLRLPRPMSKISAYLFYHWVRLILLLQPHHLRRPQLDTNLMTVHKEVYKAIVVGGGPAGIGVFIRAARTGYLPRLLNPKKFGTSKDNELSTLLELKQMGVAILHAGKRNTFGGGNLGEYIINSNTFASSLLASILDEKPELDPPESIRDTFLESVRTHESAKRLEEIGALPGKLTEIGRFLHHVGACLIEEISGKACDTSTVLLNTTATKYEVLQNGLICVETQPTNGSSAATILYTEHLVLATGGKQELPSLDNPAYHSKLFASDSCLREDGFAKLKKHILALTPVERKICIVGGSHSSFSVAWLLLNNFIDSKTVTTKKHSLILDCPRKRTAEKSKDKIVTQLVISRLASTGVHDTTTAAPLDPHKVKKCMIYTSSTPNVKSLSPTCHSTSGDIASPKTAVFSPKDIVILHRSPIRCYYSSKKEAEVNGVDGSRVDRSGCVNTFTGLREDAKALFKSVKSGRERRVRLLQLNQQGSRVLTDNIYAATGAIVWGAGYKTNLPLGFDEVGRLLVFHQDHGVIKVDKKARLQLLGSFMGKWPSIQGLGLGFSLRSAVDEMGMETRVDGVTVYHRRGAALVLEALFGPEVYGTSSSFEEMVEKNEKKKREVQTIKVAQKMRIGASRGADFNKAFMSPSKDHIYCSESVTTPHSPAAPTARFRVRQSPNESFQRQTDSPPKKMPIKLPLLKRRASADFCSSFRGDSCGTRRLLGQ